jgi:hypothetical protein
MTTTTAATAATTAATTHKHTHDKLDMEEVLRAVKERESEDVRAFSVVQCDLGKCMAHVKHISHVHRHFFLVGGLKE